jgi:hypothetical protein
MLMGMGMGGFMGTMAMVVPMTMTMTMTMTVLVPVVPQLGLVEQEEKHQAYEQGQKELMWAHATFKSLRQQMQERRGHQSPGGQTQHVLGVAAQNTKAQPSRHPNTANARHQSAQQNRQ